MSICVSITGSVRLHLSMCIPAHLQTCLYGCLCLTICPCVYIVCMPACLRVCVCVCVCASVSVFLHVYALCMCVCVYACVDTCVCSCVCLCARMRGTARISVIRRCACACNCAYAWGHFRNQGVRILQIAFEQPGLSAQKPGEQKDHNQRAIQPSEAGRVRTRRTRGSRRLAHARPLWLNFGARRWTFSTWKSLPPDKRTRSLRCEKLGTGHQERSNGDVSFGIVPF